MQGPQNGLLWKILQETGIPGYLRVSWETCMQVKKQQLQPDMEQRIGSKFRKEYNQAAYHHPDYLISMQSASWKILDWMNHKLESRFARRNINNLRNADDTTLMAERVEELKSLMMKVKEESEKAGLKLDIQKPKIIAADPITSCQTEGGSGSTNRF